MNLSALGYRALGALLGAMGMLLVRSGDRVFAQDSSTVVIEHADSLVGLVLGGERARQLVGNVRIRQGTVVLTCARALQMLSSGRVEMTGGVRVVDSMTTFEAPRATYFRDQRMAIGYDDVHLRDGPTSLRAAYGEYFTGPGRAFFRTRVVVEDTASILRADSLEYFRASRRSIATGWVSLLIVGDNVTVYGRRLDNSANLNTTLITGAPVLVQIDTASGFGPETLVVRSSAMVSLRDPPRRLIAIDSVSIIRGEVAARCARAEFFTSGDSIQMRGSPVVWHDNTQVFGDSMNMYLERSRIRRVDVLGAAFASTQPDSSRPQRFDQLSGDRMTIFFAEKGLERIMVFDRSMSITQLYEDVRPNGLNRVSGDSIDLLFRLGKLDRIVVRDGVEGVYVPENLVYGKETEYRLEGFRWRTDRPVIGTVPSGWRPQ